MDGTFQNYPGFGGAQHPAYNIPGAGVVGSGTSLLTLPAQPGTQVQYVMPPPPPMPMYGYMGMPPPGMIVREEGVIRNKADALTAEAAVEIRQTKIVAEAEANEALGVGLGEIEKQNQVFLRQDPGNGDKFRILAFNKLCMYLGTKTDDQHIFGRNQYSCMDSRYWSSADNEEGYSVGLLDSKGKEVIAMRRMANSMHICPGMWQFGPGCFWPCCIGCCFWASSCCWKKGLRCEVDMPAGTNIGSLFFTKEKGGICACCCCSSDRYELHIEIYAERNGSKIVSRELILRFPNNPVTPSSPATFSLVRKGNENIPIGRLVRQFDKNTGHYQVQIAFPAYDVSGKLRAEDTMYERGLLVAAALFLEIEYPETSVSGEHGKAFKNVVAPEKV